MLIIVQVTTSVVVVARVSCGHSALFRDPVSYTQTCLELGCCWGWCIAGDGVRWVRSGGGMLVVTVKMGSSRGWGVGSDGGDEFEQRVECW